MDSFEYLITLVSVIAGLGITRTLSGIARLFEARRRISVSWVPICWTISILLWLIAFWWFTFLLSTFDDWSLWLHVFVLIYAGSIFFLLAVLHPERIGDGHDMLEYFLDNRKTFFAGLICVAIIDIADTLVKVRIGSTVPPILGYSVFLGLWISLSGIGFVTRNRTFHAVSSAVFLVSVTVFISYVLAGILSIV